MTLQPSAATTATVIYLYQVSGVRPNPSCPCDVPDNVGSKYYKFIDPKIRTVVVRSRCRLFCRSCFRDFYFCFLFFSPCFRRPPLSGNASVLSTAGPHSATTDGVSAGYEWRRYVVVRRLLAGPSGEACKQVSTYLRMLVSAIVGPKPQVYDLIFG